jgi:superfamily I DNA/RNA helicase
MVALGYHPAVAEIVLTSEQVAVLAHDRGRPARVLAGPGTGKSATLVALIAEIVKEKPSPRVRLLTFTRAATAELAEPPIDIVDT